MSADVLLSTLDAVKRTGPERWIARCPAHDDKRASLAVAEKDEGRYLLVMTEGLCSVDVLFSKGIVDKAAARIIHGSLFPMDQNFAKVCVDVHEIKVCMETGRTVVLMYCDHIFECLYDVLNKVRIIDLLLLEFLNLLELDHIPSQYCKTLSLVSV